LWHAAVDERIAFACGAGASFARRMADGTGISMLELNPEIARELEVDRLISAIAPM
jgi:hypothetical protein